MTGPAPAPAVVRALGAVAVVTASILFLTVFDWGSPPNTRGQAMRAVALSRAR